MARNNSSRCLVNIILRKYYLSSQCVIAIKCRSVSFLLTVVFSFSYRPCSIVSTIWYSNTFHNLRWKFSWEIACENICDESTFGVIMKNEEAWLLSQSHAVYICPNDSNVRTKWRTFSLMRTFIVFLHPSASFFIYQSRFNDALYVLACMDSAINVYTTPNVD
jgi:hypothetical protein